MANKILIFGGTVVNDDQMLRADVLVEDGKITRDQEEAKESGIEIPPIFEFETLDEIISNKDMADNEDARSAIAEDILC
uniref:Amidohydrolase n=1 Tax=Globodera pallida TaxID=36090 RepID=A0A183CA29_GLOPA